MLAPVTELDFGAEALLELNLSSAALWPQFAAELEATGLPTGYSRCGALHVAVDRDEAEELRRLHAHQRVLGLESEWLAPAECRRLEPGLGTRISGGIHVPSEAQVDPRKLVAALAEALVSEGGVIQSGIDVVGPVRDAGRVVGVETATGERHLGGAVLIAAGAWSANGNWLDATPLPLRPLKGQIVRLRGHGSEPVCTRLVRTPWVYVVARESGEVVVGATVEERGFDESVTAGGVHELLREAYRVLPDVAELEFASVEAGLRPATPDNAPIVGPAGEEGLFLATGHHRNGVLLAPATAGAVAAMVTDGSPLPGDRIAQFGLDRFQGVRTG
jgi:glycine oxidase